MTTGAKGRCQQAVTSLPLAGVQCQQLILILPSLSQTLVQACSGQHPSSHGCQYSFSFKEVEKYQLAARCLSEGPGRTTF